MQRKMVWSGTVAGAMALAAATPENARDAAAPFLSLGNVIEAPRGFVDMCRHSDATFCGPGTGAGDATQVTGALAAAPQDAAPQFTLFGIVAGGAAGTSCGFHLSGGISVAAIAARPAVLMSRRPAWIALAPPACAAPALSSTLTEAAVATGADALVPVPAATVTTVRDERRLVQRVNRLVNGRVTQRTDEKIYGREEVWERSGIEFGAQGDCEDLAIEKRYQLIRAGFNAKRLSFAVVYRSDIGLHTVLVARMAAGDMVLDSRTPYIERWDRTPYVWVSVQSETRPMEWRRLGAPSFTMASAETPAAAT